MKDGESQDASEKLAQSVAEQLDADIPKDDIVKGLSQGGLSPLEARQFVEYVDIMRYEAKRQAGTKDLLWGVGLTLVAAAITWGTWAAAEAGGTYWFMWGLVAYGMFRIIRGIYRKVTTATDAGGRLWWVFGGVILIGGIVGGGVATANMMTTAPQLTPPSESFVILDDNTFWENELLSTLSVSGVITNTHSQWSINNVEVEVEAIDDAGNVMSTYTVQVIPSIIPPGGKGLYSKKLQLPYSCVEARSAVVWQWVPP